MTVVTKRVYEPASPTDGRRYLVDRLWPRGVSRERAALTEWLKSLAPSPALRAWYGHDPDRYSEFRRRFREELESQDALIDRLVREARARRITLVFAAADAEHCNAGVLRELIEERMRSPSPRR